MNDQIDNSSDKEKTPKLLFRQIVKSAGIEEVSLEIYDNGTVATTKFSKKASGWGGGGGSGGNRTCSGSCGGATIGPINCPTGSSPHLNCVTNTLTCVSLGGTLENAPVIVI